ncbi:MAG: twin-arginine translocase TatA/TatE family subunit [Bacteroidota bacterium]|jgi:sec-independent protein translocase protein TatA
MGNLGVPEILLILFVLLVFFGAKKIPELAQGLGKGIREFKKAVKETEDDINADSKKLEEKKG